jgi:thymidylate synthase
MVDIQYKELIQKILDAGQETPNRTDTNTIHVCAERIKVDISTHLACITLKQMAVKTVIRELIWFLRGSTNALELAAMGCHIWDANTTRDALDIYGLHNREVGEAGPIYGAQWRGHASVSAYGTDKRDQLADAIHTLRTDPTSRRIIIQSWNVGELHLMALPPCHFCIQFLVWNGRLQTIVTQRSADVFLGVPFNLFSYSILAHLVGAVTGLPAGELTINFGDAHIYINHIEQCRTVLQRDTLSYPVIQFSERVAGCSAAPLADVMEVLSNLTLDDFQVVGLQTHGKLTGEMAV